MKLRTALEKSSCSVAVTTDCENKEKLRIEQASKDSKRKRIFWLNLDSGGIAHAGARNTKKSRVSGKNTKYFGSYPKLEGLITKILLLLSKTWLLREPKPKRISTFVTYFLHSLTKAYILTIWDRLFGLDKTRLPTKAELKRFGRYSDAYKEAANYAAWESALQCFEDGDYLTAFEAFFTYLRDETEDNVRCRREGDALYFELYQGSKRISGVADTRHFRAEAKIARLGAASAEMLQQLTAMNYELKYSRFAIDPQHCLCIIFASDASDASPYKLYQGLKEMALKADKQDDLLLAEYKELLPVEVNHLHQLSSQEKQIKLAFLQRKISSELTYFASNHCNPEEHPGAIAYLLLDLIYKLDYLLRPEGRTMESLERMHRMYFAREEQQAVSYKNLRLIGELQELQRRAAEHFEKELYHGKSTFGLTLPVNHDRVKHLISGELRNMDWYQENGYGRVALAVPGYIVGYCLFNFAVLPPLRDFFHLYYRVREHTYFKELGSKEDLLDIDGRPAGRAIRSALSEISERHRSDYPRLRPQLTNLRFDSLVNFSRSYLRMLHDLDLSKV